MPIEEQNDGKTVKGMRKCGTTFHNNCVYILAIRTSTMGNLANWKGN